MTEQDVKAMVRKCMKHLKLKKYELGITMRDVNYAVSVTNCKNTKGARAGRDNIYVGLNPWQANKSIGGNKNTSFIFDEYDRFNQDKVIGKIECKTLENMLFLIVAHEVSHHVQRKLCPNIKRFKDSHQKPHGKCFQEIYRYLRKDLVNPVIEKAKNTVLTKEFYFAI